MIGIDEEPEDVIEDLLWQFAYRGQKDGRLALCTGGLSALEGGFAAIGWEDPHPAPELECQAEGCHEEATCGTSTPDGYKKLCGKHYRTLPKT